MLNSRVASVHGCRPGEAMFGRTFNGWTEYEGEKEVRMDEERVKERIRMVREVVFPAVEDRQREAAAKRAEAFSKANKVVKEPFPEGCLVNIRNVTRSRKFEEMWEGPYRVVRMNRGGAYVLMDSTGALLSRNVAPELMRRIGDVEFGESEVVNAVVDHRTVKGEKQYLVEWKDGDRTWEKIEAFDDQEVVRKYWRRRGTEEEREEEGERGR